MKEEREEWYMGRGYDSMHLQGRSWAGKMKGFNFAKNQPYRASIYDTGPTFESYGVLRGSADLMEAVPDDHKKFLADLVWVHEEDELSIVTGEGLLKRRLIAVHAGLEKDKPVEDQIKYLKAKDTSIPKIQPLSGRKNVWDMPEKLIETPTILVSGHHGQVRYEGRRFIIDQNGGHVYTALAASVFPEKNLVIDGTPM